MRDTNGQQGEVRPGFTETQVRQQPGKIGHIG